MKSEGRRNVACVWSRPCCCFFCKQKTAYEMAQCDWSSDVCSSELVLFAAVFKAVGGKATSTVDEVLAQHSAHQIGLRPGDEIVAIGNRPVTPSGIVKRISGSDGRPLALTVVRHGRVVELGPVRPRK